jgi:glycosyltransferase involved in cell wall biosynthesis
MKAVATSRPPHICLTFWGNLKHDARVIRTAGALVHAGAAVTVVCTDTQGDLPKHEEHPEGFSVRRIRRPSPRRMRIVDGRPAIGRMGAIWAAARGAVAHVRLALAAFQTKADVYHSADIFPLVVTWVVARLRRRPILYEAYEISTDREGFQPIVSLVRAVERFLCRRVNRVFATTEMRAAHLEREYDIARPDVLQNRPPYRPAVDSNLLRDTCAIGEDHVVVLYQGGLQPGRGLFNLLEAAEQVEGAVFVLMGTGVLQEALREHVKVQQLQDKVMILPAVRAEDLHSWTCSADVGVQVLENTCLNHYTTDSNKLFEYAMAGLPVVASDFPEIRKVVSGYDIGVLVDPADVSAIGCAIQNLVDDCELRQTHRRHALRAAPELSWGTQVPVLLEAYGYLCNLPSTEPDIG